jgi:hypothetical protein
MHPVRALSFAVIVLLVSAQALLFAEDYSNYEAVTQRLDSWAKEHPGMLKLFSIGKSGEGRDIWLMRVAAAGAVDPDDRPALFIGGNVEGTRLLGTEAAMACIRYLLENSGDPEIQAILASRCVYVAPLLNPDVACGYFDSPRYENPKNSSPVNEDRDLSIDEDGPEDIDKDGFISTMRYKAPDGEYIPDPDDPRLMRKADQMKGESGIYKLTGEGIDNDGDGRINEDPPGGVELNRNFPHDFQYFNDAGGLYPAGEPEAVALLEFFVSHRNIAMVFTFSGENNLLNLQRGKGPAKLGAEKVKVPERMARYAGLDQEQEYTIAEIVELVKGLPMARGMEITEEMVASFLGLGPVMAIPDEDFKYYEEISKGYKKVLEEAKIDDPSREAAPAAGSGSFVTWAYFQYGVPAFTVDLWAVPKEKEEKKSEGGEGLTVEKLKEMTPEDFLALGEEKIAAFLKEINAPSQYSASMVINAVKGGMITPKKMAEMIEQVRGGAGRQEGKAEQSYILKWADQNTAGGGFIPWREFDHPTLGKVEIGGMKPFLTSVPPFEIGTSVLSKNAEFAVKLVSKLAAIEITDVQVKALEDGIYEVSAFVRNNGFFPTSMRQGITSRGVPPIIVKLDVPQESLMAGVPIHRISAIPGNGISNKFVWVVRSKKGSELQLTAVSAKSGSDTETITLP